MHPLSTSALVSQHPRSQTSYGLANTEPAIGFHSRSQPASSPFSQQQQTISLRPIPLFKVTFALQKPLHHPIAILLFKVPFSLLERLFSSKVNSLKVSASSMHYHFSSKLSDCLSKNKPSLHHRIFAITSFGSLGER